ncbi:MAG: transposase family protein [Chitinophagales bacterium]
MGFQGIASIYICGALVIPYKKKRAKKSVNNELTIEQKQYNKEVGKQRIAVEHSIGGMKRYQILVRRNRCKSNIHVNDIVVICAALWNFSITT